MALFFHQFRAGQPQLHPCVGVDGVVDAAVVGNIAAGHAAVGGVDDGVTLKCGDVALPEIQSRLDRRQVRNVRDALSGGFTLQIVVLHLQELRADVRRSADIHQPPQQLALAGRI